MSCWRSCCAVGIPVDASTVVAGLPSAADAVMFLLSQLLWPPPCCCRLHWFCKDPCCVGCPVVAFIPAVACVPADVSGHDIAVILNLACCWRYCCCLCHCCCLHPVCGQAFLLFLAFFKFLMVSWCWSLCYCDVPGVTNGVVGLSAVPFEQGTGGPAVTGFPAVDGLLSL